MKNPLNKKTIALCAVLLVSSIGLSACSQSQNPLTKAPAHEAGQFLAQASQAAEQKLKWPSNQFGEGGAYGACMMGQAKGADCKALYHAMLDYAKTKPRFKTLTLLELTDAVMFKNLRDAYKGAAFALLPS